MVEKQARTSQKLGFTLVELSVVVVIISVIMASIISFDNFVQYSKLKTVVSDFARFKTGFEQFRSKYEGIPGDLSDAESYFSAANTDNGNGNGVITDNTDDEEFLAWQHLALAGFLEAEFSGSQSGADVVIGEDIPAAPFNSTAYRMITDNATDASNTDIYTSVASVYFGRFADGGVDGRQIDSGALTPEDALYIDEKVDDNKPYLGQMVSLRAANDVDSCTDSGEYKLSNEEKDCVVLFRLQKPDLL
jgi:prepilin-type N-terminal cleavage/methylation domain-containing protein